MCLVFISDCEDMHREDMQAGDGGHAQSCTGFMRSRTYLHIPANQLALWRKLQPTLVQIDICVDLRQLVLRRGRNEVGLAIGCQPREQAANRGVAPAVRLCCHDADAVCPTWFILFIEYQYTEPTKVTQPPAVR